MKVYRWIWLMCVCCVAAARSVVAQVEMAPPVYCLDEDRGIFDRYLSTIRTRSVDEWPDRIIQTALFFQGAPYVAATLEREPEGLVVNLRELDCTTFAETVLALSRTSRRASPSFAHYCDELRSIRYRSGEIHDYTDRLHYMADWFYENERKGIVRDMSCLPGAVDWPLKLSFISTHPDSYKQLKGSPERVSRMALIERTISERSHCFLPKERIADFADKIRNGDLLCFVTSIEGLDVTHVGIAYWQEGRLTFIHASSSAKKVIVQPGTLKEYMEGIKRCKGVIVARPLDH